MVSKSQIKLIKSLQQKKYRLQHKLFVAEGKKMVQELLASDCKVFKIFVEEGDEQSFSSDQSVLATKADLKQMSSLKTPSNVVGVFYTPQPIEIDGNGWILMLDSVRDPGNLGTIVRLCDWFGIRHLVCSPNTVDCFNPKVLQATMGSIARVNVVYTDLLPFIKKTKLPVYGTFMDGASVYGTAMPKKGILVMGNEGQGISPTVKSVCSQRISIPQFGRSTTESLNVATATAIFLNEIRRN